MNLVEWSWTRATSIISNIITLRSGDLFRKRKVRWFIMRVSVCISITENFHCYYRENVISELLPNDYTSINIDDNSLFRESTIEICIIKVVLENNVLHRSVVFRRWRQVLRRYRPGVFIDTIDSEITNFKQSDNNIARTYPKMSIVKTYNTKITN